MSSPSFHVALRPGAHPRRTVIAALCLVAQLAALVHLVVVRHARCAHGEAVHVDAHAAVAIVHAPAAGGEAQLHGRDRTTVIDEVHEHCVAGCTPRPVGGEAPRALHLTRSATQLEAFAPAAAPAPRLSLFRLAPKSSPPRAA